MRPGDLSVVASTMNHALKSLNMRWDEAREMWNDPISKKFNEQFMEPLGPQVSTTLKAVARLNQVMASAYEECV